MNRRTIGSVASDLIRPRRNVGERFVAEQVTNGGFGLWRQQRWATESSQLARSNAYAIPKDGRLGQDYLDKNISVVNDRLSMASVRLAAIHKTAFQPQ